MNNTNFKYKEITNIYSLNVNPSLYNDTTMQNVEKSMNKILNKGWKVKSITQTSSHISNSSRVGFIMTVVYYTDDYDRIKLNNS